MSQFYAAKANAAMLVLRYQHSHDIADMEKAAELLDQSVGYYGSLAKFGTWYRFANGMQTGQRKIPVPGAVNGKPANYLWSQLLPVYQKELDDFHQQVAQLRRGG
jgi:hypothetical protein